MHKKDDWSVVLFCFCALFFLVGMQRSSGVLFVEILHLFNINHEVASIPFTVQCSIYGIVGPFAGYLGTRYDPNLVVFVGCFLGSLGIGISFVSQNITAFSICWGLYGIGHGLSGMLIPVLLNNSFDKFFATACGVAFSGMSVGGIVLPILIKALIETYSMSGAILIISGLTLHLLPFIYMLHCNASRNKISEISLNENNKPITCISGRNLVKHERFTVNPFRKEYKISLADSNITEDINARNEVNTLGATDQYQENHHNNNSSTWYPFMVFLDFTFLAVILLQGVLIGISDYLNTILVDMYIDKNVRVEKAVYILAGMSAADIAGRLVIARISDKGLFTAVNLAILCQLTMSACHLSLVWCNEIFTCALSSIVHGFAVGGLWTVLLPIFRKFIEEQFIAMAMSSRNIFSVPIIFTTPPVIGFFKDGSGSYNGLLLIFSSICFISAIVTYFIPLFGKTKGRKKAS